MPDLGELIARLEPVLGRVSAAPAPLSGGITNRNYRLRLGERDCVLRVPGRDTGLLGIDRAAERLAAERAASLGIGPELLYADADCAVTAFVSGARVQPDQLRADPGPAARALRAFHDSGLELPVRFWIPDLLCVYAETVRERVGRLPDGYERAQALVERIVAALPLDDPVPCHDDLLAANLIRTRDAILLVDWEYAGIGHRYFDLGNLAVNNGFDEAAELRLLEAYFGERVDGTASGGHRRDSRLATLRLYRLVSDAREAAWGVVSGLISELDFDFTGYAEEHFERLERAAADPRDIEELLHAATA